MQYLSKSTLDSIEEISKIANYLSNHNFSNLADQIQITIQLQTISLMAGALALDRIQSTNFSRNQILASLQVYDNVLKVFTSFDFSYVAKEYSQLLQQEEQILLDFIKISNQLNFNYLQFYSSSFDFNKNNFLTAEDEGIDKIYSKKVEEFDHAREGNFKTIQNSNPQIFISFSQDWYTILDKLKTAIENWYYKQINKHSFTETDIQTGIASHLNMLEAMLNADDNVLFRFDKESCISEGGRVDFIFRFINPLREAAVEIKVLDKTNKLKFYGSNQLLDYMKRRKIKEGIRLVFNKTNQNKNNFEKNNIIHYFINLNQLSSSSLN